MICEHYPTGWDAVLPWRVIRSVKQNIPGAIDPLHWVQFKGENPGDVSFRWLTHAEFEALPR